MRAPSPFSRTALCTRAANRRVASGNAAAWSASGRGSVDMAGRLPVRHPPTRRRRRTVGRSLGRTVGRTLARYQWRGRGTEHSTRPETKTKNPPGASDLPQRAFVPSRT